MRKRDFLKIGAAAAALGDARRRARAGRHLQLEDGDRLARAAR